MRTKKIKGIWGSENSGEGEENLHMKNKKEVEPIVQMRYPPIQATECNS